MSGRANIPSPLPDRVGADGVFFAGWRGHDDLPDALAACDALVMPSVDDSYPQAPLEAMAVGLPVIATLSGGFPQMINLDPARPTGWLVPPDDELALAEAMVEAVNRPDEISRRGRAALVHAQTHLSWTGRVDDFNRVYTLARDRRTSTVSATYRHPRTDPRARPRHERRIDTSRPGRRATTDGRLRAGHCGAEQPDIASSRRRTDSR